MKILIVDDEHSGREIIKSLLINRHASVSREIRLAGSADEAFAAVIEFDPDLVFLDVNMPGQSGFDVLERLGKFRFEVIFVTAHDQYALDAFRVNALDYLLKPIELSVFDQAVNKAVELLARKSGPVQPSVSNDKIGLTTRDGFVIINIQNIIRCEADSNYTVFVLEGNQKIIVSRTLKEAGKILEKFPSFLRVQRSFIVNLNKIIKYSKSDGGYIILSDNFQVNVSEESKGIIEQLYNVL
jgi:two-component system, LytTR family, response regulator